VTRGELLRQRVVNAPEDPEPFYDMLAPDVEWDITDSDSPMAGVYHGREEVRAFYRRWMAAFSDWGSEIEQVFEKGDVVVFFAREHGHGRTSGVWTEMKRANVWTFRGDQVVRFKSFRDRDAALRAAGIDPPRIGA
jgi:ketosteroid isomerase-like protein